MGTKGRILLHLAAALAGWGIVQWLYPALSATEQPIASGKSSIRETRDREAGEKLLRRLVPDLAPAPPLEVLRHEGTLEERAFHAFLNDTFPANPGTPGDHVVIDYLRDQIEETLSGRQGPDLSYAFRHGGLDADRILASLRERFPDLVNEPQFPRAVSLELFEIEPARAAVLLDGLDAAERTAWLMDGFRMRSESEDLSQPVWIIPAGRSDPPPFSWRGPISRFRSDGTIWQCSPGGRWERSRDSIGISMAATTPTGSSISRQPRAARGC